MSTERLLLDEMFSPALAEALRAEGFDVVAVAGHPVLASAPDADVASWAALEDRRIVTENVRDFARLVDQDNPARRVLFTSSRRFPRSRRNPRPLVAALRAWLETPSPSPPVDWLS